MSTVILVSKGPSTRAIKKSPDYKIACLNNAIVLCEEVDYFFMHDQDCFNLIEPEQWLKVKNFIFPTYPQRPYPGGFDKEHTAQRWIDAVKKINPSVKFHLVRIANTQDLDMDTDPCIEYVGPTYSILQTAITWLCRRNFSDVITCGIDQEGGYHPMFETHKKADDGVTTLPSTVGTQWTPYDAQKTFTLFTNIINKYNIQTMPEQSDVYTRLHRLELDGTIAQII